MLHQVSHYSLRFLSMPGLLTTWVCDHVWCYYVSRQKSSHKVPYFSPDTWSGVQRRWFIRAINSCASTPGRGESRLLEEKQNKNERRGRPFFSQNHSAHERNMIKSPSSSLKYQFVRLFDLFFVLYFFFQDPAFNLPLCPACCTQVPADANRAQSVSRLGTGATGRMAANEK